MSDQSAVLQSQVSVDGMPASREVVALERRIDGSWRVCGSGQSSSDGLAEIAVTGAPDATVYAVAVDVWGRAWTPSMAVAVGDVVRPSNFAGWLYRATQSGVLPSAEPEWWTGSGPRQQGSAMLDAVRYYRPLAHGPVALAYTPSPDDADPHWDKVVSLLHFDGPDNSTAFTDMAGVAWTSTGVTVRNSIPHFGGGCGHFARNGLVNNYLRAEHSSDFSADGPFTVELFFMYSSIMDLYYGVPMYLCRKGQAGDGYTSEWILALRADPYTGKPVIFASGGDGSAVANMFGVTALEPMRFYHFALSYDGAVMRMFLDGVLEGQLTVNIASNNSPVFIGWDPNVPGNRDFRGLIDEFRITKGVARYASNFTPPVRAFPNQ